MSFFSNFSSNQTPSYNPTQRNPIDLNQLKQGVQQLDQNALIQLVQRARAQGIPDSQIEAGLNYILNLK